FSKKNIFSFKLTLGIFLFFNIAFLLPILSSDIMQRLNFGNIDYTYIALDKSSKKYIPSDLIYIKDNIKIISYEDNNLTFEYSNKKISKNCSQNCIEFKDKNGKNIETNNQELTFKEGKLILKNDTCKEEQIEANATILKDCLTYVKENNETIELHNITALSALGEFWYLKTSYGDRFEISSELIKSKVKK
ncbi:MAG: hypothetical protein GX282_08195, partial [Campylobacteraceae bacterium]|nr:hypothetical protein [Campylobacteraceae bacterium]